MMIALFFKSLLIGYSGAVMPGPMFTYTVDRSLRHGAKSGLLVSIGHSLLELLLVVLISLGAGKFLAGDIARTVIGLLGGIVLCYLGFGMIRDVYRNRISLKAGSREKEHQGGMFLAGVTLSATNPYFIIWWSVVGLALITSSYSAFGIPGVILFYTGHILSDISWFTFLSVLVSKTRHLINIEVYKVIIVLLAICLTGFGISFFAGSVRFLLGV